MKRIYNLLVFAAFAAAATACSDNTENSDVNVPAGNVEFVTAVPQAATSRGPVYQAGDFRILAFKNDGTDFVYMKDIPLEGMNFNEKSISGTVQLPAGVYKFLPSYGLTKATGTYAWPTLTGAALSDALYITHSEQSFPAAFMLNTPLASVDTYTVSLDGPKQTVNSKLRRSVSRVDVLFIRADKDAQGGYTEKPGDDVFGPEKLAKAELTFTDANSRLGLSGEKVEGVFTPTHTIAASEEVLTMGTGAATTIGSEGYDFENVQPGDIISGSAHLKGTYLIPNADNTPATGFSMKLTSGENTPRTITLTDKIPVERNKATLIRVYVLGENVFTTGVDFKVEVDTVWDGSNFVDGDID